ncbi:hypothetical protein LCGC14_1453810 [marine sediment metagenome]|uniref:U-box domain-containing protein n=1 Tax=marine sediment metagenome TaxID=412755 RepID=A0A0F9K3A3_9ZZZZ
MTISSALVLPKEFECPISMESMKEPVLAKCSHTFERSNIEEWLKKNPSCPICDSTIDRTDLVVNRALADVIKVFFQMQEEKKENKSFFSFLFSKSQIKEPLPFDMPDELLCPISTTDVMKDPVISKCSHTFERSNIEEWLKKNPSCPMCRKEIDKVDLVANRALEGVIQFFFKQQEIPICVHTSKDIITLDILPSDTISTLKRKFHDRNSLPPGIFVYNNRRLKDENKTMKECNIQKNANLYYIRTMKVHCRLYCPSKTGIIDFLLDFVFFDTVKDVREALIIAVRRNDDLDVDVDVYINDARLEGHPFVEESRTLISLGIKDYNCMCFFRRLRG